MQYKFPEDLVQAKRMLHVKVEGRTMRISDSTREFNIEDLDGQVLSSRGPRISTKLDPDVLREKAAGWTIPASKWQNPY